MIAQATGKEIQPIVPSGPQISAKELQDIRDVIAKMALLDKALEDIEDLKKRMARVEYRVDEIEKNKADKTETLLLEQKKADRMDLEELRKLI